MEHKALIELGACAEARAWASNYPTLRDAWFACDRADWMLWLIAHILPRERLVWVTCQIARTALVCVPAEESRPRVAIETAEAWTRGEATLEKVARASAASAAYAASYAAAASSSAADSAYSAAASAAYAASYAASSSAADSAAYAAAYAAAASSAASAASAGQCVILRREIAWEEIEAALPSY